MVGDVRWRHARPWKLIFEELFSVVGYRVTFLWHGDWRTNDKLEKRKQENFGWFQSPFTASSHSPHHEMINDKWRRLGYLLLCIFERINFAAVCGHRPVIMIIMQNQVDFFRRNRRCSKINYWHSVGDIFKLWLCANRVNQSVKKKELVYAEVRIEIYRA